MTTVFSCVALNQCQWYGYLWISQLWQSTTLTLHDNWKSS